jgi:hypothetical protein
MMYHHGRHQILRKEWECTGSGCGAADVVHGSRHRTRPHDWHSYPTAHDRQSALHRAAAPPPLATPIDKTLALPSLITSIAMRG